LIYCERLNNSIAQRTELKSRDMALHFFNDTITSVLRYWLSHKT